MPCLIAALENERGEITGVQRTYLPPGGMGIRATPPIPSAS
ncbi:DUF7146 domain-containing protein [Sphingobium yanoikuyae]